MTRFIRENQHGIERGDGARQKAFSVPTFCGFASNRSDVLLRRRQCDGSREALA